LINGQKADALYKLMFILSNSLFMLNGLIVG